MEEKKQIENEHLTKVYHTNHIVEAITVEKRCTGIARYRKVSRQGQVNLETGEYIESKARASPIDMEKRFISRSIWTLKDFGAGFGIPIHLASISVSQNRRVTAATIFIY